MAITEPITLPAAPAFKTTSWTPRSVVGVGESTFTLNQQVQVHQGQRWEFVVTLPAMLRAQAAAWQATFLALSGRKRRFLIGDPAAAALRGAGGGAPIVDGANQTGEILAVSGLPDASGVWLRGDFIQLGSGVTTRLHMVLTDVSGAGSPTGEAQVDLWPRLRESPADGSAIVVSNTKGTFRMASSEMSWTIDHLRRYGISFAVVEAF